MFFVLGIYDKEEKIEYNNKFEVHNCGKFGDFEIIKKYTTLSLFFISTFKWNKKYFALATCCGSIYELPLEIGEKIESNEYVDIKNHLTILHKGIVHCPNCGYKVDENYTYCPNCGKILEENYEKN